MKFEKFIHVFYLIGAGLVAIGLMKLEMDSKENSSAIKQLKLETAQLESRVEQLQQQLFDLQPK